MRGGAKNGYRQKKCQGKNGRRKRGEEMKTKLKQQRDREWEKPEKRDEEKDKISNARACPSNQPFPLHRFRQPACRRLTMMNHTYIYI